MSELFLRILNVSITASWLGVAVFFARFLLKKSPRWVSVVLWALVGIRLICPISIESSLSMIPSTETVPKEIITTDTPQIHSGVTYFNSAVNPIISDALAPSQEVSKTPAETIAEAASVVWLIGVGIMLIYCAWSYIFIRLKVREAAKVKNNIFECDRISTPFVLGLIKPRIYLPSKTDEKDTEYVIAHEMAHIKRLDHIWKPLGFLLLSVYWFNPVLWVAYVFLCRDIEVACDERVLAKMGEDKKADYSSALINCSVPRKMIRACPLAFGEVGVKRRVKNILSYKKPAFWLIVVGLIVCIAVGVFFLTDPLGRETELNSELENFIKSELAEPNLENGEVFCAVDLDVLDVERDGDKTTVYAWVFTKSYTADGKGASASHIPSVITVSEKDGKYTLEEYWLPKDGNEYAKSIKEKFPRSLRSLAKDNSGAKVQEEKCDALAKEYFMSLGDDLDRAHFLSSSTELDGVKLSIASAMLSGEKPYIVVEWSNGIDETISFGESFTLTYYDEGTWRDALLGDGVFHMTAREVKRGTSARQVYYLENYDLSHTTLYGQGSSIMYKFETTFRSTGKDDDSEYKAWIYFDILDSSEFAQEDNRTGNEINPHVEPAKTYLYNNSKEPFSIPGLSLLTESKTFSFTYSAYSSYVGIGDYEETESEIICRTHDGLNVWVFKKDGDTLVFDGKNSSPIPSYKYSSSSAPECPVPDGAVFAIEYFFSYDSTCQCDIDSDGVVETLMISPGLYSGNRSITVTVHVGGNTELRETTIVENGIYSLTADKNTAILEINRMHMSDMGPYYLRYRLSVVDGKLLYEKISEEYLSIEQ
ncbi:MAG: hypothetical protein IKM46_00050 [Clostridia bacterium]|nr:hypothetical protein [Clostridia bacterium]